MKILDLLIENGTSGGTGSGSIANLPNAGGPMMPMIRRMPPGQSFFAPLHDRKPRKIRKNQGKNAARHK
jgi:hypothetical protein